MTNGCICCNVREDLIKTFHEIHTLKDKFDSVIIETTGVADPSPVLHSLKQDQLIRENYEIDSIICLIDGKNFQIQIDRSPEVKKQIIASNFALINKCDLIDEKIRKNIVEKINLINPDIEIIETEYSKVPLNQIFLKYKFNTSLSVPRFLAKAKHQENISSRFFEFPGEMNQQFFSIWIDLLFFQCGENLYRMKGILNFKNEPHKVYFQSIHDYLELSKGELWSDNDLKNNQIVVIGLDLDYQLIESGFKSCIK